MKEFQRGRPAELDDDVKANAMRHMMPKEILDAVDLQPQYRTFSEIRDYMLQQARQRADVYEGDVCHSTKKIDTDTPRVSTNTNTPTAVKTTTPVPMDVSQMSSNVSKPETEEQESDSYQDEQDQDCDGDEVYAVTGKGKGGFKGTCFKCGMRGHKIDRCWQRGKGKGSKGDWEQRKGGSKGKGWSKGKRSHLGHTWDSSWYNSHWHGKTYSLEVDPWSAVELISYLFAVSLSSSCEEFIGTETHDERNAHTKTSQPGSPKNFAHVNKFSILAPDDNEFTGEGCISLHTPRSQRQQRKCGDERVDECRCDDERVVECITGSEAKFPSHQDPAHQS